MFDHHSITITFSISVFESDYYQIKTKINNIVRYKVIQNKKIKAKTK